MAATVRASPQRIAARLGSARRSKPEGPDPIGLVAHDFSSETQGAGAEKLHGVTHHGPYDGQAGNDDDQYSYFDNGTTAQYNTAKAAMGLGNMIPEDDGPFGWMRQQTKDNWFMFEWQTGVTGDPTL